MVHSGLPKLNKKKMYSIYISITTKYFYSKAIKLDYVFSDINFRSDSDWVYSLQEMYWASRGGGGGGGGGGEGNCLVVIKKE